MCLKCIILPLRPEGLTMLFLCPEHYSLFWALLQAGSDYWVSALSFPWQGIFLTPDKINHLPCSPTDSCTYPSWHESQIFACSSFFLIHALMLLTAESWAPSMAIGARNILCTPLPRNIWWMNGRINTRLSIAFISVTGLPDTAFSFSLLMSFMMVLPNALQKLICTLKNNLACCGGR